jgi:hypothetical protein
MTTYSYGQLEGLWIAAGGPAAEASTAAAVAIAESGGNPLAAYPGTTVAAGQGSTTDATGLWQILGLPSGDFTAAELTDPLSNAKMAVAKYEQAGNSFSPWQTYDEGDYTLQNVAPIAWTGGGGTTTPAAGSGGSSGTAAVTGTAGAGSTTGESAVAAAGGFDPLSLLSDVTGLARDLATVIDYVFGMFGRGQGWRLAFTAVFAAAGYGAYRCLAGAGAVPDLGTPKLAMI